MKRLRTLTIFFVVPVAVLWTTNTTLGQDARYRARPPEAGLIRLPQPQLTGTVSVEQTLAKRRSVRQFTGQGLTLASLRGQGRESPTGKEVFERRHRRGQFIR
jgi:hypothetical protein